ncbi:MAG TPA: DoxX family membrane protein [Candidatus Saccharimonadales bacterium]|nr:DoxX family membrane protein [Candidatus Saccharimonadales bacterium]
MAKSTKATNDLIMVSWLLRIGLAAVFLYAAVGALQHPLEWAGFLPSFLRAAMSPTTLVKLVAVYELALVAWLLSGKYVRYAALLCAVTLAGIIVTNPSQLIITFRDIGLLFMALALFFVGKQMTQK